MIELELPYPPSVNRYWRHVGSRVLISREGREFRKRVCVILAPLDVEPLDGPLAVAIEVYPPDRRRRDLDNAAFKSTLDALQHGGAYRDDSQIKELHAWMRGPVAGGRVLVQISRIDDAQS